MSVDHHAYSGIADDYDLFRPGYPAEFLARTAGATGLAPGATVVDAGAGTGKLTRALGALGLRVAALEPLAAMRALIPRGPGVAALGGVAERLPFSPRCIDAIVAGQAWHWFDARAAAAEAHRVLKPGGCLVVITNTIAPAAPWAQGLKRIRARYAAGRPADAPDPGRLCAPLAGDPGPGWSSGGELRGGHPHTVPREALAGLVLTTSTLVTAGEEARRALTRDVLVLAEEHGLLDGPDAIVPLELRARWVVRASAADVEPIGHAG